MSYQPSRPRPIRDHIRLHIDHGDDNEPSLPHSNRTRYPSSTVGPHDYKPPQHDTIKHPSVRVQKKSYKRHQPQANYQHRRPRYDNPLNVIPSESELRDIELEEQRSQHRIQATALSAHTTRETARMQEQGEAILNDFNNTTIFPPDRIESYLRIFTIDRIMIVVRESKIRFADWAESFVNKDELIIELIKYYKTTPDENEKMRLCHEVNRMRLLMFNETSASINEQNRHLLQLNQQIGESLLRRRH